MQERPQSRNPTIELPRRAVRSASISSKTSKHPSESSNVVRQGIDPSEIPNILNNVYVVDGYDPNSSILACNFPINTTTQQCRAFFSWFAPVIYVERASSVTQECNFIIVFATPSGASKCLSAAVQYGPHNKIFFRRLAERDTLWRKITNLFTPASVPVWEVGINRQEAVDYIENSAEKTATQLRNSATSLRNTANNFRSTISENWQSSGAQKAVEDVGVAVNQAFNKATERISNFSA